MDNPPRYVSGQSLFSMVEEQLASGKRVRFARIRDKHDAMDHPQPGSDRADLRKGTPVEKGRHHPISALFRQVYPAPYYKNSPQRLYHHWGWQSVSGWVYLFCICHRESGHHTPEGQTHQLQRPAVAHPFLALDGALPVSKMDACVFDLHTKVHEKS